MAFYESAAGASQGGDSRCNAIADRCFKPGEVISKPAEPFLYVLCASERSKRCNFCFRMHPILQKCVHCGVTSYCGKTCARKDWEAGHEVECPYMADGSMKDIDVVKESQVYHVLMAIRFILKARQDPEIWHRKFTLFNGTSWSYADLISHSEMVLIDRKPHIDFIHQRIQDQLGIEIDYDELVGILGRNWTNAFAIHDEAKGSTIGAGVYMEASRFDHSCEPNAVWVFQNNKMEVRAVKPIAEGEEIYVSYINLDGTRDSTRTKLALNYYFDCGCSRCSKPIEEDPRTLYSDEMEKLNKEMSLKQAEINKKGAKSSVSDVKKESADASTSTGQEEPATVDASPSGLQANGSDAAQAAESKDDSTAKKEETPAETREPSSSATLAPPPPQQAMSPEDQAELTDMWMKIINMSIKISGLANKYLSLQLHYYLMLLTSEAITTTDSAFYQKLDPTIHAYWKHLIERTILTLRVLYGKDNDAYKNFMSWVSTCLKWPRQELFAFVRREYHDEDYESLLKPILPFEEAKSVLFKGKDAEESQKPSALKRAALAMDTARAK